MNRAPSVLGILFHKILFVVMSTVCVLRSPGYVIRFPPAVILTQLKSYLWCLKSTTRREYLTNLSWGIYLISLCGITKMEQVPGVFVLSFPLIHVANFFPNSVDHISRVIGSLTSFCYLVIVFPVMGWMNGAQKCSISTSKFVILVVGLAVKNAPGFQWYTGLP